MSGKLTTKKNFSHISYNASQNRNIIGNYMYEKCLSAI